MSVSTERARREYPDVDAEREVDLGRYGSRLAAHWWLPLLGLVLGAIVGYLLSLGGAQTYRAQSVIYLGQPYGPNGGNLIQSPATNPATVREIVKARSNLLRTAADTGLPVAKLAAGVSAAPVGGAAPKLGQTPLVAITVKGSQPGKIARAANELAQIAVRAISAGYVETKIKALQAQIVADEQELAAIDKSVAQEQALLGSLGPSERLSAIAVLGFQEQRRAIVSQDLRQTRPLLSQAQTVERGRILTHASASRATARSGRNSGVAGALLGLLLGGIAALLWEPLGRRLRPAL